MLKHARPRTIVDPMLGKYRVWLSRCGRYRVLRYLEPAAGPGPWMATVNEGAAERPLWSFST